MITPDLTVLLYPIDFEKVEYIETIWINSLIELKENNKKETYLLFSNILKKK